MKLAGSDLVLTVEGLIPGQPGLFFQGTDTLNSGLGVHLGDGLHCAGGGIVRLGVRFASGIGLADSTGMNLAQLGGVTAGETRYYQYWYRDISSSPCGNAFNLSNGVEIVWEP